MIRSFTESTVEARRIAAEAGVRGANVRRFEIYGGNEMSKVAPQSTAPPRIEYLRVQKFRALREVEFKNLTPMAMLLGPNGSGKSTVFDVFASWPSVSRVGCGAPGIGVDGPENSKPATQRGR